MTGHNRTHNRTQPDTTGHRPDTSDISDIREHDTVQNTPDTTGHYRTLPDTQTEHLPDMLQDMTGHYRTLPDIPLASRMQADRLN